MAHDGACTKTADVHQSCQNMDASRSMEEAHKLHTLENYGTHTPRKRQTLDLHGRLVG